MAGDGGELLGDGLGLGRGDFELGEALRLGALLDDGALLLEDESELHFADFGRLADFELLALGGQHGHRLLD